MKKFKIKVCGITRPSDANLVAELGGDIIGLIFFRKSPRYISIKKAKEIIKDCPVTLQRVGLFVNEATDKILSIAEQLKLDYIQLHGSETEKTIKCIQRAGYRVIKSFTISVEDDFKKVEKSSADLCLLDNGTEKLMGGTGKRFDWSLNPKRKIENLVLAGGLNIDNLAEGVRLFDPAVVDVNSGVEIALKAGLKSPSKLKKFFQMADKIRYGK